MWIAATPPLPALPLDVAGLNKLLGSKHSLEKQKEVGQSARIDIIAVSHQAHCAAVIAAFYRQLDNTTYQTRGEIKGIDLRRPIRQSTIRSMLLSNFRRRWIRVKQRRYPPDSERFYPERERLYASPATGEHQLQSSSWRLALSIGAIVAQVTEGCERKTLQG